MRMKRSNQIGLCLCVLALVAATAGCESARKSFGGAKSAPDEFVVFKRPPLSLPPGYGLRPPSPGAARLQTGSPREDARKAVLGARTAKRQSPQDANLSRGLQTLLRETGANAADADIRKVIDAETSVFAKEDKLFVNKLIFWVDEPQAPATVVDAKKERQRIMQNQALGKPITEGETPQVKRKQERKGILNF